MLGLNILSLKQVKIQDFIPEPAKDTNSSSAMNFLDMLSSRITKNDDEGSFKKGTESLNNSADQDSLAAGDSGNILEIETDDKKISAANEEPARAEKSNDEISAISYIGALFQENKIEIKAEKKSEPGVELNNKIADNKSENKNQPIELKSRDLIKEDVLIDIKKETSADNKTFFTAEKSVLKKIEKFGIENDPKKTDQANIFEKINSLLAVIQNSSTSNLDKETKSSLNDIQDFLKNSSKNKDSARLKKAITQLESAAEKMTDMKMSDKVLIKNLTSFVSEVMDKVKNRNIRNESKGSEKSAATADILFRTAELSEMPKKSVTMKNSTDENMSSMNTLLDKNASVIKKTISSTVKSSAREVFQEQLQQIIDKAKISVTDSKNGNFIFKLNPKELGSVNVNIGLEQGVIKGKFLVETNEAKDLLIQNLDFIKSQLEESGISVGDFQVNVKEQGKPYDNKEKGKEIKVNSNIAAAKAEEYENTASVQQHNGSLNLII